MDNIIKTKEGLTKELHKLNKEYDLLKASYSKNTIERKQVEEELRESKQIIEGIISTIPTRVFWKDKNLE